MKGFHKFNGMKCRYITMARCCYLIIKSGVIVNSALTGLIFINKKYLITSTLRGVETEKRDFLFFMTILRQMLYQHLV